MKNQTHILTTGDIVKLKEPYKPEEWVTRKPKDWRGFEYGVVVEITSTQMTVNGESYGNQHPRNVSLHLYDSTGQLMITPLYIEKGLCIPTYVDFHLSELILYKIATETGYLPVKNPPDWENLWKQEESILREFLVES